MKLVRLRGREGTVRPGFKFFTKLLLSVIFLGVCSDFRAAAASVSTFASNCTTAKTTFCLGDTVCAQATVGGGALPAHIEWLNPSSVIKRTSPSSSSSPFTDSYVPDSTGNWTVRAVRDSNGSV